MCQASAIMTMVGRFCPAAVGPGRARAFDSGKNRVARLRSLVYLHHQISGISPSDLFHAAHASG